MATRSPGEAERLATARDLPRDVDDERQQHGGSSRGARERNANARQRQTAGHGDEPAAAKPGARQR